MRRSTATRLWKVSDGNGTVYTFDSPTTAGLAASTDLGALKASNSLPRGQEALPGGAGGLQAAAFRVPCRLRGGVDRRRGVGPSNPPAATTTAVACPLGTEAVTFAPGLKLAVPPPVPLNPSVPLGASGALAACVSLDLHHTSGTITFTGSGPLTCPGGNSTGSGRVTWSDPGTTPSDFTLTGGGGTPRRRDRPAPVRQCGGRPSGARRTDRRLAHHRAPRRASPPFHARFTRCSARVSVR